MLTLNELIDTGIEFSNLDTCSDKGKYEGCPTFAVAAGLSNGEDDIVCSARVFYIERADIDEYPDLAGCAVLLVWDRDDGGAGWLTFDTRIGYDAWVASTDDDGCAGCDDGPAHDDYTDSTEYSQE